MSESTLSWVGSVIGRKKIYIIFLLMIQIVLGISSVYYAVILKHVIDEAVEGNYSGFYMWIGIFTALVIGQIALRAVNRFLEEYSRSVMENCYKERLFVNVLNRDYSKVSAVHSGEWMNRLTSDTVVVADGMAQIVPGVVGMVVKMTGALIMIIIMAPVFGYILIPGGTLLVLLTYGFRKILKKLHKKVQEADGNLRVYMQESLSSMLVIRAFAKESQVNDIACDRMKQHKKARMKKNHFSNFCNIGFGGVMQGAYVLGAGVCGYGILTGTMTYGTFMAMLQLIGQVQSPFANITGYLPKYYAMLASAERLMEIESYENDIESSIKSLEEIKSLYENEFRSICITNARFTYQAPVKGAESVMPLVFKNVNIRVNKGECVALTGPSGCGKSTILKLLMCLYTLDSGNEKIILKDDKSFELVSEYRRLFSYVPQGNHLMSGTIREIVAFEDKDGMKLDKNIWGALEIACASDFVKRLDDGIDTLLGERGMGLSEGQMQRIAIARAIYSDNPILMLDESTSALDEKTEKMLLCNLRRMTDKTVMIVTHRRAVLEICDKEIAFIHGNVIENECR